MTNAARHAQTHNCAVHLQAEDTRLTLSIFDDGRGHENHAGKGFSYQGEVIDHSHVAALYERKID